MEDDELISISQAADRFGLSANQLRLLAKLGRLRATKVGKSWVTTPSAVAEYLANTELRKRGPRPRKRS